MCVMALCCSNKSLLSLLASLWARWSRRISACSASSFFRSPLRLLSSDGILSSSPLPISLRCLSFSHSISAFVLSCDTHTQGTPHHNIYCIAGRLPRGERIFFLPKMVCHIGKILGKPPFVNTAQTFNFFSSCILLQTFIFSPLSLSSFPKCKHVPYSGGVCVNTRCPPTVVYLYLEGLLPELEEESSVSRADLLFLHVLLHHPRHEPEE